MQFKYHAGKASINVALVVVVADLFWLQCYTSYLAHGRHLINFC